MSDEVVAAQRGASARGLVSNQRDDGAVQTMDVETHEGVARSTVEVHQPYGFASLAPEGAVTLVFALGGDAADTVALPPACPEHRWGGLLPGESVLYDWLGNRLHFREGGIAELVAAELVKILAKGVRIEAPEGVDIVGDLRVQGQVSDVRSTMQAMRETYNGHTNPNNGNSAPPQKMT